MLVLKEECETLGI